MRVPISLTVLVVLFASHSYAFFDDLKSAVEQGTLQMTDKGEGTYDSTFQCPPFSKEEEAEASWKKQVTEFCAGDFNIIEKRYEKDDINTDVIYATIECVSQASGTSVETTTEGTDKDQEPASVVTLTPEKTKKTLIDKSGAPSEPSTPTETAAEMGTDELQDPEIQTYIVKLDSHDPEVFRTNARDIYYKNLTDPILLDAVEKKLLSTYRLDQGKIHTDGMGWLCKVLGGSGQGEYIEILDRIATSGATFKLRWHAALQRDKLVKLGAVPPKTDEQKKLDIEKKLVELKELYDQGLITESEYSEKKAELLEQM